MGIVLRECAAIVASPGAGRSRLRLRAVPKVETRPKSVIY